MSKIRYAAILAFASALVLYAAVEASAATTTTFKPVADAYVRSAYPSTNFGNRNRLRVDGDPADHSYLRFRVEGLDAPVTRAVLRLYARSGNSAGMSVHRVSDDSWGERTITHENAPPLDDVIGESDGYRRGEWVAIDVTSAVGQNGVVNLGLSTTSTSLRSFFSRGVRTHSPELVVRSGSEPAPTIAAAGDIACAPNDPYYYKGLGSYERCRQKWTSSLLDSSLSAVLALGDNQYENGELANFQQSFGSSWGRVKSLIRPVAGDREYRTANAQGYFDYFNGAGASSGPAGDRDRGYYSFDLGSWHLIALNSNCAQVGGCGVGSPQQKWLKADLAAHPGECTLAYWHHPRFASTGNATEMSAIWRDLYDANVELVLSADARNYERFAPQDADGTADDVRGIRQFVVGTGGHSLQRFGDSRAANSETRSSSSYGVLKLALRAGSYAWEFTSASGSNFSDSGSQACHGTPAP